MKGMRVRRYRYPRCCEMAGMGRPPARRYVWQVGSMQPEVASELTEEAVERLAQGLEDLVGRAAYRSQALLPGPVAAPELRLGPLAIELVEQDVRITAWPAGAHVTGPVPPEPPALVVLLDATCARAFAHACRAALTVLAELCPFCGEELNPRGHVCPRANGYRR